MRCSSAICRSRAASRRATATRPSRSTTCSRSPRSACSRRSSATTPARLRVLVVRGADDPRRAAPAPARPHVVGARAARPAGARPAPDAGDRRARPASSGARRRSPSSPSASASTRSRCSTRARRSPRTPRRRSMSACPTRGAVGHARGAARRRGRRARHRGGRDPVEHYLDHLPPRSREVLRLRFEKDLKQREIGAILGVSQMHVSRLIRQSLEQLQAIVAAAEASETA